MVADLDSLGVGDRDVVLVGAGGLLVYEFHQSFGGGYEVGVVGRAILPSTCCCTTRRDQLRSRINRILSARYSVFSLTLARLILNRLRQRPCLAGARYA